MFTINKYRFNVDVEDVIETLRSVLINRGIDLFSDIIVRPGSEYITVTCPYHKDGQERKPSAGFRKDNGYFSCFTCSEKHSFQEVIAHCFNISEEDAIEWLKENFPYSEVSEKTKLNLSFSKKKQHKDEQLFISSDELQRYRKFHPYMFERKLSKDTVRKYDIGYDDKTNSLVFPNKDEQGNILFLARRSVSSKRFNYPKDVDKPIYGLYELYRDFPRTKKVIITESMINCLTAITWGYPAVALNGTGSSNQIKKLEKLSYTTYYLALDGDNAGQLGTKKLIEKLQNKKFIYVINIPKGKDVNDLNKDEFDTLFTTALTAKQFLKTL